MTLLMLDAFCSRLGEATCLDLPRGLTVSGAPGELYVVVVM